MSNQTFHSQRGTKGVEKLSAQYFRRNVSDVSDRSFPVVPHRLFLFVSQIASGVSCAPCRHLVAWDVHGSPAPLFRKMPNFGFEARDGNFEVLALLLKYGVDETVRSSKGQTPLDMARLADVSWS